MRHRCSFGNKVHTKLSPSLLYRRGGYGVETLAFLLHGRHYMLRFEEEIVVFADQFRWEDTQKVVGHDGQSDPIDRRVSGETKDGADDWQDALYESGGGVASDQEHNQPEERGDKEDLPKDGNAAIFEQGSGKSRGLSDMKEQLERIGAPTRLIGHLGCRQIRWMLTHSYDPFPSMPLTTGDSTEVQHARRAKRTERLFSYPTTSAREMPLLAIFPTFV